MGVINLQAVAGQAVDRERPTKVLAHEPLVGQPQHALAPIDAQAIQVTIRTEERFNGRVRQISENLHVRSLDCQWSIADLESHSPALSRIEHQEIAVRCWLQAERLGAGDRRLNQHDSLRRDCHATVGLETPMPAIKRRHCARGAQDSAHRGDSGGHQAIDRQVEIDMPRDPFRKRIPKVERPQFPAVRCPLPDLDRAAGKPQMHDIDRRGR
jgi:hypothetical protein